MNLLSAVAVYGGSALIGFGIGGFVVTNLVLAGLLLVLARLIGKRNQGVIRQNLGNLPPRVGLPLPDMDIRSGEISGMELHEDTFLDPDEGDALRYHALGDSDGDLPEWVKLDAFRQRFEFRPPPDSEGSIEIKVVARDFDGAEAETSFRLRYTPEN